MTTWKLRCFECGSVWGLRVSYDLADMPRIYHYCRRCGKNTFHHILGEAASNTIS